MVVDLKNKMPDIPFDRLDTDIINYLFLLLHFRLLMLLFYFVYNEVIIDLALRELKSILLMKTFYSFFSIPFGISGRRKAGRRS
jgi:hypothetical protein